MSDDPRTDHSGSVERQHARHANAWCDSSCGWRAEGQGESEVKAVRRASIAHVKATGHVVALDVTSLDRYRPALDQRRSDA